MINKIVVLNKKEIDAISGGVLLSKEFGQDLDTTFALVLLGLPPVACTIIGLPPPVCSAVIPLGMLVAGFLGFVEVPKVSKYLTNPPPKKVAAN